MKGKFRAIWRVSFALVLGLSVGLVVAPGGEVMAATQSFTTSDNWTVPDGVYQITVEAWGGGGAGGGANAWLDCKGSGGAGGGGGAYAINSTVSVTPGQNLTVVVGAGGIGVSGNNGTAGGDSFVGNDTNPVLVLAAGGSGGTANTGGGQPPGGDGGQAAASVGDTCLDGEDGEDGDSGGLVYSGDGGDGAYGGGSGGPGFDGAQRKNGNPGDAPGGGGGGGRTSQSWGLPYAGGAGGDGRVVITYAPPVTYTLTITSTAGGTVTTPGEGPSARSEGEVVDLVATPGVGCNFSHWTRVPAVSAFGNWTAPATNFTMPAQDVTVIAHFSCPVPPGPPGPPGPLPCCYLFIASTDCGNVTTPGEGSFFYSPGKVVSLVATPDAGCQFVKWCCGVDTIADIYDASTNITMDDSYSIFAEFDGGSGGGYDLTISSTAGGSVTTPGEGTYTYNEGTVVDLVAEADADYFFEKWTGGVANIDNVNAASTTITMPAQNVAITANFKEVLPSVTTQSATGVTTDSATLNMNYSVGEFSPVEVSFVYKKSTDAAWSSPDWVSKSADGNYAKSLTGLDSDTGYEFKAQLKYDSTVIEGTTRQFTTKAPSTPEPSGGYCFIATAAYGTPTAEQIDVLREFRDVVLLESTAGSQFVTLYYQLSPPVADFIAGSDFLRTLVRELLVDPVVWIVEATGAIWQN